MKKKDSKYSIINIVVLLAAVGFFVYEYQNAGELLQTSGWLQVVMVLGVVVIVHALKAARSYLILYGANLDWITYLKLYCKVTSVSVVFPVKAGEFFRMYCYGKQLNNMLKGVIIVLLDRFMDTIALITMIFLVWIMNGGQIVPLTYVLLAFLIFVSLVYFAFPSVYKFWKQYILRAKATERRLTVLKLLDMLNKVYQEITSVSVGRGIILYGLSLLAWAVEIGSLVILSGMKVKDELTQTMSSYLSAAMGGSASIELSRFIFLSVILMVSIYFVIKLIECFKGKKVNK